MQPARVPIVAANWKMYKTVGEAVDLAAGVRQRLAELEGVEALICPPFTALASVGNVLGSSRVGLGAQNMHWAPEGAYTGEISAGMLRDLGCSHVILGHSERRTHFRETDAEIRRKVEAALAAELTPIVCVGETLTQREAGMTEAVVEEQLEGCLGSLGQQLTRVVLAYEPVWAIGTGRTATPQQAEEVHAFIRGRLGVMAGNDVAARVRIQYGGSVKPNNASELFSRSDVDGGLIGGASLAADSFAAIVQAAGR